jgi:hypothetical protein
MCILTKFKKKLRVLAEVNSHLQAVYKVWKNSMPKLLEVIAGTETKMFCQSTICHMCVLAVPSTVKLGLTNVGNEGKPLNHSEKWYFL